MSGSTGDIKDEALALTKRSLIVDMYTTSFSSALGRAGTSARPGWFSMRSDGEFDLPKIVEGGLNIVGFNMPDGFELANSGSGWLVSTGESTDLDYREEWDRDWADFTWPPEPFARRRSYDAPRGYLTYALTFYDAVMAEIEFSPDKYILVRTAQDIRRARGESKIGIVLDCNCIQVIEDSLELLRTLHRLGYRDMLLARWGRNLVADSWVQSRAESRLTPFGVAAIREMNRIGMIVDLSHTSDRCFHDVLEVSEDPVICSHSNSRTIYNHPRNLTDDQAKVLAEKGGVVGLMTVFIGPGPRYQDGKGWAVDDPRFQKWLDHFDHLVNIVGMDHVGWGSDGYGTMVHTPAELPKITEGLLRRGYSRQDIEKALGANYLRVFERVVG